MGLIKILPKNTRLFGDKKAEVDTVLGDELDSPYDDDELDLDALMSEDFSVDETGGGRSTKDVIIEGGVEGVIAAIKSPETYIGAIDAAIPKEYRAIVDLYDAAGSATTDIGQELKRTVRPKVNKALKALNSMVPSKFTKTKSFLDKNIKESDEEGDSDEEGGYGNFDSKDPLLDALEQITKAKDNTFTHKEAIMISEDRVYKQGNISLLGNMLSAIELGQKYEEQVNYQFHKLGIEIQHKQLDVQTRLLDAVLAQTKLQEGFLEAIRHNTSLPDFVKTQMNEQFAQLTREKLLDGVREGVFGDQKGVADIVRRFKDKTISRLQGGGESSMLGELFKDKSMLGNVAGRTAVGEAAGGLAKFLFRGINSEGDILDSNGKKIIAKAKLFNGNYFDLNSGNAIRSLADIKSAVVNKSGKVIISAEVVSRGLTETGRSDNAASRSKIGQKFTRLNDQLSNIPLALRNLAKSSERKAELEEESIREKESNYTATTKDRIKAKLKSSMYKTIGDLASSSMPGASVDDTVQKSQALEKHADFDSLFYRSVTESIPNILQSILKAVGGGDSRYDFKSRKMMSLDKAKQKNRSQFQLDELGEKIDKDVDALMTEMQLDKHKVKNKLKAEIREVLRKEYRNSIQSGVNTIGSTNDILDKLPARSKNAFKAYMKSISSQGLLVGKDAHINRVFKDSGRYDVALRKDLSKAQSELGVDALMEAGVFKVDKDGNVVINYGMLLAMEKSKIKSSDPSDQINNPPTEVTDPIPEGIDDSKESFKDKYNRFKSSAKNKASRAKSSLKKRMETIPASKEEIQEFATEQKEKATKAYTEAKQKLSDPSIYEKHKQTLKESLANAEKHITENQLVQQGKKGITDRSNETRDEAKKVYDDAKKQVTDIYQHVAKKMDEGNESILPDNAKDRLMKAITQTTNGLSKINLNDVKLPAKMQQALETAKEAHLAKTTISVLERLGTDISKFPKKAISKNKDGLLGEVRDALKSVEAVVSQKVKSVEASSFAKRMKNGKFMSSEAEQDERQHGQLVGVLNQIRSLMKETKDRISVVAEAYEPKDASQVNENGDLLGSFKDVLWKRKQKKEAKEQKRLEKEKKEEKDGNSFLFKALGLLGTGLITGISTLVSAIGGLSSIAGGLLSLLGGGSLLGKLGDLLPDGKKKPSDLLEDAADLADKNGKKTPRGKKGGLIKRAFQLAGKAPGALWDIGKAAGKYIPSTGTVLKTAGRLALGGAGVAARVGIGAVGALATGASATAIAGVAAVGAIGYGAYKLYKGITDYPDDVYTKMRLAQYGLIEQHSKDFDKIYSLEEYIRENALVSKDGQFVIDNTKVDMQTVADIFTVSMASEKRMTNLIIWYKDRFTPIYLHAVEETNKRTKSTDLRQTRRLDDKDRDIIAAYSLPNGPYHIGATPLEGNIATGYAAVDEAIKLALGAEKGIGVKLLNNAVGVYDKLNEMPSVSKMGYELGQSAVRKAKAWWSGKPEEPVVNPPTTPSDTKPVAKTLNGPYLSHKNASAPTEIPLSPPPSPITPSKALNDIKTKAANPPNTDINNQPDSPSEPAKSPEAAISIPKLAKSTLGVYRGPVPKGPLKDGKDADKYMVFTKGATLEGLLPEFQTQLRGMIQEYGELTGKKVQINEGFRSYEEQVRMKKIYGANAATPGSSIHGVAAADIQTADVNAMEKLGLMKKYGMARPVRKTNGDPETWHIEPSLISTDPNKALKDREWAKVAVVGSIGRGGGGYATIPNSIGGKMRNKDIAEAVAASGSSIAANDSSTTIAPTKGIGPISSSSAYTNTKNKSDANKTTPSEQITKPSSSSNTPSVISDPKGVGPINSPSAYLDKSSGGGEIGSSYYGDTSKVPSLSESYTPTEAIDNPVKISPKVDNVDPNNQPDSPNKPSAALESSTSPASIKDLPLSNPPKDKAGIIAMLDKVAKVVGINASFLKGMITMESQFKYDARPYSARLGRYLSSARGIGQFLDDTWAEQIRKHGKKYGLTVNTPRENTTASALITAHYVKDNTKNLPNPNMVDGYFTHFLGPGGAKKIANAPKDALAANILPKAAKDNPDVFFKNGKSITVAELYDKYKKRIVEFTAKHGISVNPDEHPLQAGSISTKKDAENTPAKQSTDTASAAAVGGVTSAITTDTSSSLAESNISSPSNENQSSQSPQAKPATASLAEASVDNYTPATPEPTEYVPSSSNDGYYGGATSAAPIAPPTPSQTIINKEGEATIRYFADSLVGIRDQINLLTEIRDILKNKGIDVAKSAEIMQVKETPAPKPVVKPPNLAAVGMKRVSS